MIENINEFAPLGEVLKWLLNHIYLCLIFFYGKGAKFVSFVKETLNKLNTSLEKLITLTEQHDKRISTLERAK